MPGLKKKKKKNILFFSVKGKLSTFVPRSEHREKIEADVLSAHEAVKLALFFFRAFYLHRGSVPDVTHSSMNPVM